jgi:thiamine-monophosphate kinase
MREFDLIARLFSPLATNPAARGLKDDAAVLMPPAGQELIFTKDMLAADVHFFSDDPPETIAAKLVRVNLSDIAAMGGTPIGVLFGAGLTGHESDLWLEQFAHGMADDLARFQVALLGGDTISGLDRLTLSLTAIGHVAPGQALSRSGARAGDDLYVSGQVGDAALGLQALLRGDSTAAEITRYRMPEPRLALGQALIGSATAAADVSDGLLADAGHLADASGLAVRIDLALVPAAALDERGRLAAATAGDDYELVFSAPASASDSVLRLSERLGVKLSKIGDFRSGSGVEVIGFNGKRLSVDRLGYQHG